MPIPRYDEITLPFLEMLSDQKEHALREMIDALGVRFKLTESERSQLLPSGQQPIFDNRVGWARTYMKKAGLLLTTKRAHFQITARGLQLLETRPNKIDSDVLIRYPGIQGFHLSEAPARQIPACKSARRGFYSPGNTGEVLPGSQAKPGH